MFCFYLEYLLIWSFVNYEEDKRGPIQPEELVYFVRKPKSIYFEFSK